MPTQTLPIPTDAGAREMLLHRVSALAGLRHPCLEPVAAFDVRDDGSLAVRRGAGAASDLPTVLAVRGRLTSREAAGVLVAAARGLAALHSEGLAQGALTAADVVLGPGGEAMLRPRAGGTGEPDGDPGAADVHALAALVGDLLGDRADDEATALRAVLAPAAAPDPRVRPEAGTLAAQADAAVPSEPVRLPEAATLAAASLGLRAAAPGAAAPARRRRVVQRGAPAGPGTRAAHPTRAARRQRTGRGSRRAGGPSRGVPRGVLGAIGAVGLVVVLAAVALQVRPPDDAGVLAPTPQATEAAATTAADRTQDRDDPAAAAAELTERRGALLSGALLSGAVDGGTGDGADDGGVDGVDVPGSPAHDADVALLDEAARAGTQVRGAEVLVDDARTERHDGDEAEVVVEYSVGPHEQVADDGEVTAVPASDPRQATLRLAWTPDGWRVAEVG